MPKKTPEQVREKVVALYKEGRTYTEMEKTSGLARPTIIRIVKEAGLTGRRKLGVHANVEKVTPPPSSVGSPSVNQSLPVLESGVHEFMPEKKAAPRRNVADEAGEFECDNCGAEFTFDAGDELPDACPECGQ